MEKNQAKSLNSKNLSLVKQSWWQNPIYYYQIPLYIMPQSYVMVFLYYIMRHSVQIAYWILIYTEYFGKEALQSYIIFHTIFFYHRSLLYNEAFWHIKQCKISKAEELISLPLDDLENYTKVPLSYCDKSHYLHICKSSIELFLSRYSEKSFLLFFRPRFYYTKYVLIIFFKES